MRRHVGSKKFVCDVCGNAFVASSDLRRHVRVHTGEKPFTCTTCFKTFRDGSSYKRHCKIHDDVRHKFPCSVCGKDFSRVDLRNYHMKKFHL